MAPIGICASERSMVCVYGEAEVNSDQYNQRCEQGAVPLSISHFCSVAAHSRPASSDRAAFKKVRDFGPEY